MVSPSRRRWHFSGCPCRSRKGLCSSWQTPTIRPRGAAGGFALQPLALVGACTAGSAGRVVVCHGDPIHRVGLGRLAGSVATRLVPGPALDVEDGIALSAALVRAGPPVVALVLTVTAARAWPAESPHGLCWLPPAATRWVPCGCGQHALRAALRNPTAAFPRAPATTAQADRRSTSLRLAHTAIDAIAGTALLLVWQRLHGLADASYLAMLLRLLGFIPPSFTPPGRRCCLPGGNRSVAITGGGPGRRRYGSFGRMGRLFWCWTPLRLPPRGRACAPTSCLWCCAVGSACISAALSHRPFQHAQERQYSWLAIALQALQLVVLVAPLWAPQGMERGSPPLVAGGHLRHRFAGAVRLDAGAATALSRLSWAQPAHFGSESAGTHLFWRSKGHETGAALR